MLNGKATVITKKIAFLCLAHNNFDLLAEMSRYYCADQDGLFVHIDKNVSVAELPKFHNKTVFLTEQERYRTAWGSFNIVLATIALIKKALADDDYQHFVLLSGADLPLLSKADLKAMLLEKRSYLAIWHKVEQGQTRALNQPLNQPLNPSLNQSVRDEFFNRHYYQHALTNPGAAYLTASRRKIYRMLLLNKVISWLPLAKKRFKHSSYYKGSQWWCVSRELAQYFCQQLADKTNQNEFCLMHAPDEKVFQTLAMASPYKENLVIDEGQASLKQGIHYIDWGYQKEQVALQTFTLEQLAALSTTGCAFARKYVSTSLADDARYIDGLIGAVN
ncbi:MAG: beta-1,6-N-acetylglucosaminyltransferase [Thalassotalea sp.]